MAGEAAYRPEAADYVAASRAGWWRSVRRRRFRIQVAIGLLIVTLLGITLGLVFQLDDKPVLIAMMIGGYIGWLIACVGIGYLMLPRRARRLFRQQKALDQEFVVSWSPHGAKFISPKASSDLAWGDYLDWAENDGAFILTINDGLYHFVPKRVLDATQTADLRDALVRGFAS